MHPNLAELYRSKVANLHDAIKASPDKTSPEIRLTGALASMIQLTMPDNLHVAGSGHDLFARSVKVVAGVGFEPTTFRL